MQRTWKTRLLSVGQFCRIDDNQQQDQEIEEAEEKGNSSGAADGDNEDVRKVSGPFWIGLQLIISRSSSHVEGDSQRRMRYVGVNHGPSV